MSRDKYFVNDPEGNAETFATQELAIARANELIQYYRDLAPEGWPEQVEQVYWGEIKGCAAIIESEPYNPAKHGQVDFDCDAMVDYGLVDIGVNNAD